MKVGVFQLLSGGHGRDAARVYENNLHMAREAEAMGFHAVWAAEHHFSEYGMVGDPLLYLTAVAAQTSRIRLGTGVVVVPLYHPVRLAENAAFLDVLSGGRLDLGVGRGYQPHEFLGFDVPQNESTDRTAEAIELMTRLWIEESVDHEGRFYHTSQARLVPRPVQQPHPPLWTAAVSPGTFSRAGSAGERILTSPNFTPLEMIRDNFKSYREALTSGGFEPSAYEYPVMQQVYVGENAERAYDEPAKAAMEYFKLLGRLLPSDLSSPSADTAGSSYDFYRKVGSNIANLEYDYLFNNGVCFGEPARVVDQLNRLEEEVGMTYFMAWLNFGSLDHGLAMASMRRLADDVLPHFEIRSPRATAVA